MEGLICLSVWIGAMLLLAGWPATSALVSAHRSRGRWGDRTRPHEAMHEGPYRAASTTEPIARRAPLGVWIMAIAAPAWASVTLLVFCPLVGAIALAVVDGECGPYDSPPCGVDDIVHVALGTVGLALAVSGIVLSVLMIRDTVALPTATVPELRANRVTAVFGAIHHLVVLAWGAAVFGSHGDLGAIPLLAFPCAIGLLIAILQWSAGGAVARALLAARASASPEHSTTAAPIATACINPSSVADE